MSAMSFAIANSMRFSRENEYINYLHNLKKKEEAKKKKGRKGLFIWRKNVTKNMNEVFEPRENDEMNEKKKQKISHKKRCCI